MKKPNLKRIAFVREYLIDRNGGNAAIRAGYAPANSRKRAFDLLRVPEIAKAVAVGFEKQLKEVDISQEWVISKLMANAERAMRDESARDHKGKPTGSNTYNGAVANRAYELIGKHLGMFSDKTEVDLNFNVTISRRDADGL